MGVNPVTPLIGSEYRTDIPNVSGELSGGTIQILSYRARLNETYLTLRRDPSQYEVFNPPCVLIIGSATQLDTSEKRRTFELLRQQFKDVQVVTFDEFFGRVRSS
jgi:hypothetical protein